MCGRTPSEKKGNSSIRQIDFHRKNIGWFSNTHKHTFHSNRIRWCDSHQIQINRTFNFLLMCLDLSFNEFVADGHDHYFVLRIIDERHLLFIVSDCCQTNEIFMKTEKFAKDVCDKNKYEQRECCTLVSFIFVCCCCCLRCRSKRHHTFGKRSFAKNRMCARCAERDYKSKWSISVFCTFLFETDLYIFRLSIPKLNGLADCFDARNAKCWQCPV